MSQGRILARKSNFELRKRRASQAEGTAEAKVHMHLLVLGIFQEQKESHVNQVSVMCPNKIGSKCEVFIGIQESEGFEGQLMGLNVIQDPLESQRNLKIRKHQVQS